MRENRERKVHYRIAKFEHHLKYDLNDIEKNGTQLFPTLEDLIISALNQLKEKGIPAERQIDLFGYKQELSLVHGEMKSIYNCRVSVLFSSRKGDQVPAIGKDSMGVRIIPEHVRTEKGELLDPAQETVFFAISGNNIAYCSNLHNADKKLQEFFEWLLSEKCKILPENNIMYLESQMKRSIREGIQKYGIKRLCINPSTAVAITGSFLDEIKMAFINRLAKFTNPIIQDDLNWGRKAALEACSFQLTITTGRSDSGLKQEALQYYCLQLNDAELEEFKIELANGDVYNQGDIVTNGSITVEYNSGVINQYSVLKSLSEWLDNTLKNNQ